MIKILLVEDEVGLQKSLTEYLQREGFQLECASTLEEAESQLLKSPDIVLLDWMLPDGQGIELLKNWRARGQMVPTILLTARVDLIDKVLGLELGANDYVTKPFEPRELVARIRVQLRQSHSRSANSAPKTLLASGIELNLQTYEASYLKSKMDLTKTEFELLKLFIQNPSQVFTREELLKQVWGYDQYPTTRTVDTHIMQLRQKTKPEFFETVHGIGYRFRSNL